MAKRETTEKMSAKDWALALALVALMFMGMIWCLDFLNDYIPPAVMVFVVLPAVLKLIMAVLILKLFVGLISPWPRNEPPPPPSGRALRRRRAT